MILLYLFFKFKIGIGKKILSEKSCDNQFRFIKKNNNISKTKFLDKQGFIGECIVYNYVKFIKKCVEE